MFPPIYVEFISFFRVGGNTIKSTLCSTRKKPWKKVSDKKSQLNISKFASRSPLATYPLSAHSPFVPYSHLCPSPLLLYPSAPVLPSSSPLKKYLVTHLFESSIHDLELFLGELGASDELIQSLGLEANILTFKFAEVRI